MVRKIKTNSKEDDVSMKVPSKYPGVSSKTLRDLFLNEGFKEADFRDNWYLHFKKGKHTVQIPKINSVPPLYLDWIIENSGIPTEKFLELNGNKKVESDE